MTEKDSWTNIVPAGTVLEAPCMHDYCWLPERESNTYESLVIDVIRLLKDRYLHPRFISITTRSDLRWNCRGRRVPWTGNATGWWHVKCETKLIGLRVFAVTKMQKYSFWFWRGYFHVTYRTPWRTSLDNRVGLRLVSKWLICNTQWNWFWSDFLSRRRERTK